MWNLSDNEIQELNLRWCQKVVNGEELLALKFVEELDQGGRTSKTARFPADLQDVQYKAA